ATSLQNDSMLHIQQIHERHDEHPYDVNKMPVQAPDFQIHGVVASTLVTQRDYSNSNAASSHVREMQASNTEECGAEQTRAPTIPKNANPPGNQAKPLLEVQEGKHAPAGNSHNVP